MPSVYEIVTDRIIASLEAGVIPWRQEWKTAGKSAGLPYNLATKKAYRGINIFTLLCSPYASRGWMTYKQAQSIGAQVRKGEKSTPIIYWQFPTKAELLENPDRAPFARMYSVFNSEQIDGLPEDPAEDPAEVFNPIEACDAVVAGYMASSSHPTLGHGGDRAYFSPSKDHVQMPARESFNSAGGYYATLFHEFAHSTGVKYRLNRPEFATPNSFGDEPYSREELTAEFAAAFLCAETGCGNEERIVNSVAYIQHWIGRLKGEKLLAVQAAQKAQRAADYILGRTFEAAGSVESEGAA